MYLIVLHARNGEAFTLPATDIVFAVTRASGTEILLKPISLGDTEYLTRSVKETTREIAELVNEALYNYRTKRAHIIDAKDKGDLDSVPMAEEICESIAPPPPTGTAEAIATAIELGAGSCFACSEPDKFRELIYAKEAPYELPTAVDWATAEWVDLPRIYGSDSNLPAHIFKNNDGYNVVMADGRKYVLGLNDGVKGWIYQPDPPACYWDPTCGENQVSDDKKVPSAWQKFKQTLGL